MCGIAGVLSTSPAGRPAPEQLIALAGSMADTLVHRGPDDHGVWRSTDGELALSHRRLAIVDLSPLGRNPMLWDGGRLAITFNGEIYNFLELRKELEAKGHRFRSRTDTEVILAAYDEWGLDSVTRLAGMFAFALWDDRLQRLWLVRDRLGKKPLYYVSDREGLRFSSELKGILADETFDRAVDHDAVRLYLRYGYVPSPFTIYAHARKLPPAHYLVHEAGETSIVRYWDPMTFAARTTPMADADAEAVLDERLGTAVRQRMIADVPLGAFLSGGIDSSLVVALMQEQSASPVQTFTIRFANQEFNEADHAAAVARHLGTAHHEQMCDEADMLGVVGDLTRMFDEPFADSSAVPTYLVSRAARERVTVALSGDGGDELFFGYPRYRYYTSAAALLRLPGALRRVVAAGAARLPTRRARRVADVLRSDEADLYGRFITWWQPAEIEAMTGESTGEAPLYTDLLARSGGVGRADRPGLLDLVSYLPEDILTKVDRASMAVSLEVRAPLLDHRVVELALGMPAGLKLRQGVPKWILRRLLERRVPRALFDRPKMGFGVPLGDWFRGALRDAMEDHLAGDDLSRLGIDPRATRELWADFQAGRRHRTDLLWQMFILMAWGRASRVL